jgi:hypothetical protein
MPSTENDYDRWHRLSAAVEFALQIHDTQMRRGAGTPYVGHLLGRQLGAGGSGSNGTESSIAGTEGRGV